MKTIAPPYQANHKRWTYPDGWEQSGPIENHYPGDRVVAYVGGEWAEAEVMRIRRLATVVPQWALTLRPRDNNRARRFEAVVTADGQGAYVQGLA
jgi:hypothetical protein